MQTLDSARVDLMKTSDQLSVLPVAIKEQFGMKAALLSLAQRLGYEIRRSDRAYRAEACVIDLEKMVGEIDQELNRTRTKLHDSEMMRQIRLRDGIEIEGLL